MVRAAQAEAARELAEAVALYDAAIAVARSNAVVRELHLRRLTAIRSGAIGGVDPRAAEALAACAGDPEAEVEVRMEVARIEAARGRFAEAVGWAAQVEAQADRLDDTGEVARVADEAHTIAEEARRGLAGAAEVEPASAAPVLVGRERELSELEAALGSAARGRGGAWCVTGESGMGKTALGEVVAARARAAGFACRWEPCAEGGEPWRVARDATGFARVEAVLAHLRLVTAPRPLLIVLDDLHAAELAAVELLQHVAREARHLPLVVLATFRESEARSDEALGRAMAAVVRGTQRLALRSLSEAELGELLPAWGVGALPRAMLETLHRRSGGNPLFARELVVDLVARLAGFGAEESSTQLEIAPAVGAAVESRLRLLSAAARPVLESAAVIGRAFDVSLAVALAGAEPVAGLAAMEEGRRAGVVERAGGDDAYRFTSSVVRACVYQAIDGARRAALHLAFARAMAPRWSGGAEPRHAALARHFELGGAAAEVATHARLAGDAALARGSLDEADRQLRRALAAASDAAEVCELKTALAVTRAAAGDVDGAGVLADEALTAARALGAAALARAVVTLTGPRGRFDDRRRAAWAREALAAPADPTVRARLLANLGDAAGDRAEARRCSDEALQLARAHGEPELLVELLERALPHEGLDQRLALAAELAARAVGPRERLVAALARVEALTERGELAAAEQVAIECARLAPRVDDARAAWRAALAAAMLASARETIDAAAIRADEARQLGEAAGLAADAGAAHAWFVRATARSHGEPDEPHARPELEALLAAAVEDERPSPETIAQLVLAADDAVAAGDERAQRRLHAALLPFEGRHATAAGAAYLGPVALALGILAAALGRHERARAHLERALDEAQRSGSPVSAARAAEQLAHAQLQPGGDPARRAELLALARDGYLHAGAMARVVAIETLRRDGPGADDGAPVPALVRERNLWRVSWGPRTVWVRDSKGLSYLQALLERAGGELHVADLVGRDAPTELREEGDAGEVLDQRARAAYRARIEALRADPRPAAREELAFLEAELARAIGLGGRVRRVGARSERLRQSVTKRVREAISRIAAEDTELGAHLARSVRTGVFCSYRGSSSDAGGS